ncbi:MAG: type II secretion system F family protein [Aeoliella sp.]
MLSDSFPTFKKWLTTFELVSPRRWRIAPWWRIDTWTAQQRSLLHMLAAATAEQFPPGPLVARLSEDHRGPYRWRLGKLAQRLADGTPLADALEQTPGVLSPEATLAVRFGAQSGTLPAALAALIERDSGASSYLAGRLRHAATYFAGLVTIALFMVCFIVIKIFPQYDDILNEFVMEPPWAYNWLASLSGWVVDYWYVFAVPALLLGWLFYSQTGWRYVHRHWLPRLSRLAATLRGADVLSLLAVVGRAGRPLPGALSTLARHHYDGRVRQQLLFARNEVEQGADSWSSLAKAGLFTAQEADALTLAVDGSARAWTMDRLAALRREQVAQRAETLLNLLHPAIILLLAAGVLLVALASLLPLFRMIEGLA